jgi:hypothetical protein
VSKSAPRGLPRSGGRQEREHFSVREVGFAYRSNPSEPMLENFVYDTSTFENSGSAWADKYDEFKCELRRLDWNCKNGIWSPIRSSPERKVQL